MANDVEVLGLADVLKMTGIGRTKIFEMCKGGTFPAQAKLGGRASRWWRVDVQAWLVARRVGGVR
ncbi:AlpA family phage regulatory protein [Paraburkholderia sediminicola]|nr:AlpA family phage regulatory protein [Paraburkholderia sediminicola]